jgi:hypothetical protein
MRAQPIIVVALLLGACGSRKPGDDNQMSRPQPVSPAAAPTSATAQPSQPATPPTLSAPPFHGSLGEPNGPIDPKSAEAAGQVVQHYGALIEQRRWSEAERLWGSADAAAQFDRQLSGNLVHLEIGDLGEPEGAAGSIYVTMPVAFTSTGGRGGPGRKKAVVTLRRVNDVPGSTAAQRRWHIERIDWKAAA